MNCRISRRNINHDQSLTRRHKTRVDPSPPGQGNFRGSQAPDLWAAQSPGAGGACGPTDFGAWERLVRRGSRDAARAARPFLRVVITVQIYSVISWLDISLFCFHFDGFSMFFSWHLDTFGGCPSPWELRTGLGTGRRFWFPGAFLGEPWMGSCSQAVSCGKLRFVGFYGFAYIYIIINKYINIYIYNYFLYIYIYIYIYMGWGGLGWRYVDNMWMKNAHLSRCGQNWGRFASGDHEWQKWRRPPQATRHGVT